MESYELSSVETVDCESCVVKPSFVMKTSPFSENVGEIGTPFGGFFTSGPLAFKMLSNFLVISKLTYVINALVL